jgi:putative FmdB family regulatory protein
MPTYDYKCNACSHVFEHFQSMKDKPLKKCPECGKNALERLIGIGAAVIFKGSGFYQTDYRSESYKKSAEADKKPAETTASDKPKADAKPDGKSDAKSDSKTDSKSEPTSAPKADANAKTDSAKKPEPSKASGEVKSKKSSGGKKGG